MRATSTGPMIVIPRTSLLSGSEAEAMKPPEVTLQVKNCLTQVLRAAVPVILSGSAAELPPL
jgi:hypothetical protein